MEKIKEHIATLMEMRKCFHNVPEAQEEINKLLTRLYDALWGKEEIVCEQINKN